VTLTQFFQNVLNGLSIGSVYAIFALGYTLVFSILGIINFAHGSVFTLGAYFTYMLTGLAVGFNGVLATTKLPFALPFIVALLVGSALAGLMGVLVERLAFRPLRDRGSDRLLSLVSSLGVAVIIVNVIQYLVGAEAYSYRSDPFGLGKPTVNFGTLERPIPVRSVQLVIFAVSVVILIVLTLIINRTKLGKALQAVSEDTVTARLLGINTDRLILFTFFISGFLGGIAGTLVATSQSITGPYFGIAFGLKGLAVIVLGGLGNIPGAVVGGFVIGLAEAFVPSQYVAYKEAVAFALLFIILLIRPQGLLGRVQIQKV
jgi:branched-chain amino acid transport system permease protein